MQFYFHNRIWPVLRILVQAVIGANAICGIQKSKGGWGKPKGKRREENTIDFRRVLYRQLPRYIVFGLGDRVLY